MRRFLMSLAMVALVCSTVCGQTKPDKFVVVIAVDLSGSFAQKMAIDGKAYQFLLAVVETYFRDRIGKRNDRIILAQLSASSRSLLWEGSPRELMREHTARSLRDLLLRSADPNGSRLHDGVMHALEYLMSDREVARCEAKSAFFVLSDMLDNADKPEESEKKLVAMLTDYAKLGGNVGFFYVDQFRLPVWRKHIADAGFSDEATVQSEIVGKPKLPKFRAAPAPQAVPAVKPTVSAPQRLAPGEQAMKSAAVIPPVAAAPARPEAKRVELPVPDDPALKAARDELEKLRREKEESEKAARAKAEAERDRLLKEISQRDEALKAAAEQAELLRRKKEATDAELDDMRKRPVDAKDTETALQAAHAELDRLHREKVDAQLKELEKRLKDLERRLTDDNAAAKRKETEHEAWRLQEHKELEKIAAKLVEMEKKLRDASITITRWNFLASIGGPTPQNLKEAKQEYETMQPEYTAIREEYFGRMVVLQEIHHPIPGVTPLPRWFPPYGTMVVFISPGQPEKK